MHAHVPSDAHADPVLFQGVMRHSIALASYLKWLFVCVAGVGAGVLLQRNEIFAGQPLSLLGLAGVPGLFVTYLRHVTTRYKISARRVEFERGIVSKTVDSLELWRVLDVRYEQSLWDRLLGNAKITLFGTDQSHPQLVLHGLPDHRNMFEQLRELVQAARHTGRPMELVPGHDGTGIHELIP